MKAVYGLYRDGQAAQQAVNRLRAVGIADRDITVISAQPMEDYDFSHIGRSSRLWYFASGGGLIGLLFATWLARFTQMALPMNAGAMPTVSWWTNLIVMFELTMLGATLATVISLVVTSGLCRRRPALYDPEVTNGKILVGVENPRAGSEQDLARALTLTPDTALKTIGE